MPTEKLADTLTKVTEASGGVTEKAKTTLEGFPVVGPYLKMELWKNTLADWGLFLLFWLALYLVFRLIFSFVKKRLFAKAKEKKGWIGVVAACFSTVKPWVLGIIALAIASLSLELSESIRTLMARLPVLAILLQLGMWAKPVSQFTINQYIDKKAKADHNNDLNMLSTPLKILMAGFIWILLILIALDNVGIDVTALITGLGIGGIAVALAVQNVLSDILAAIAIYVDKPFVIGDFLIIGDFLGSVEDIGLKTTRLRSLGGEQIIISNSDLLASRIRNYKRMNERRVAFSYGLIYQTKADQLEEAVSITKDIISNLDNTRLDRVHFKGFGASSLDFEVVYYVLSPDYNMYMDIQQIINLALVRRFEDAGMDFAYPTQTLFVEKLPEALLSATGNANAQTATHQ